jgi:hypothetical protein
MVPFELRTPEERARIAIQQKVSDAMALARATGIPVETPGGTRYIQPGFVDDFARGRYTDAQRNKLENERTMTVGEIRQNPDNLPFSQSQMVSAGSLLNALGLFDKPKEQFVTDQLTGTVRLVRSKDGKLEVVSAPDASGIARPRPRAAGAGGSGEMKPDRVMSLENQAETLHGQRQQLGDQLAVADGDEYAPGKPMTAGTRKMLEARYRTTTNKLRTIEKRLGREQTEAQSNSAAPVAQPQASAAAPTKYPEGTIIQNDQGVQMVRKGGKWQPLTN